METAPASCCDGRCGAPVLLRPHVCEQLVFPDLLRQLRLFRPIVQLRAGPNHL